MNILDTKLGPKFKGSATLTLSELPREKKIALLSRKANSQISQNSISNVSKAYQNAHFEKMRIKAASQVRQISN